MNTLRPAFRSSLARTALAAALAATLLGACAPVLIGGAAVGGAMMASDRRTSGAQVDDQSIELKAGRRISEAIGDRGHINVTSFNRQVLLSGEVPSEADKSAVEQAVARIENVRNVVNELAVMPNSSLGTRSNDALITSKLKATYVDSRDLFANAYKVVTERGVVYLMGRVTEREATRGANLARNVSGVQKVVTLFEIISEDELAQVRVITAPPPAASGPK
ncbi:BON domain-containing protein [Caldimonas sp. KR1-144]|uniref:BON domain-containing protein n=1 Tax=Caldimonas sp. KR1-144 TaxID=3400911 RepID=UPI003BFF2A66